MNFLRETLAKEAFRAASYLSDRCIASKRGFLSHLWRKVFLAVQIFFWGACAAFATLPGVFTHIFL